MLYYKERNNEKTKQEKKQIKGMKQQQNYKYNNL